MFHLMCLVTHTTYVVEAPGLLIRRFLIPGSMHFLPSPSASSVFTPSLPAPASQPLGLTRDCVHIVSDIHTVSSSRGDCTLNDLSTRQTQPRAGEGQADS